MIILFIPIHGVLLDSQITSDVTNEERLSAIPGTPPDLRQEIQGCHFSARCPYVKDICRTTRPKLVEVEEGHFASCHFQTSETDWIERRRRIMNETIIKVENLKKHFPIQDALPFKKAKQSVKAVDGVSFEVFRGETLGIVGESGCGKSTMARLINQLIRPTEGLVEFNGVDLASLGEKEVRAFRKSIQMVFQNPYASLDPRKRIKQLIAEPLEIHQVGSRKSQLERVYELLDVVGLSSYHARPLST